MDIMTLVREADLAVKGRGLDENQVAALRLQILNSDEYWSDDSLYHDTLVTTMLKLTEHLVGCAEI